MSDMTEEDIARDIYVRCFDDDINYPHVLNAITAGVKEGVAFAYSKVSEWHDIREQLVKARELVLKLYNAGRDVLMCRTEEKAYDNLSDAINDKGVEQFLSEVNK